MNLITKIDVYCIGSNDSILKEIKRSGYPESNWTMERKLAFFNEAVKWNSIVNIDALEDESGNLHVLSGWNQLDAILSSIAGFRENKNRKAVLSSRKITVTLRVINASVQYLEDLRLSIADNYNRWLE